MHQTGEGSASTIKGVEPRSGSRMMIPLEVPMQSLMAADPNALPMEGKRRVQVGFSCAMLARLHNGKSFQTQARTPGRDYGGNRGSDRAGCRAIGRAS